MASEIDKALQLAKKVVKEGTGLRRLLAKSPHAKPSSKAKTKRVTGNSPKTHRRNTERS
jgi:hypothetical protein